MDEFLKFRLPISIIEELRKGILIYMEYLFNFLFRDTFLAVFRNQNIWMLD